MPGGRGAHQDGSARRGGPEHSGKTADKKLGFPVPVRAWLREEKYAAIVREKFESESAEKFFNTCELVKMLDQHMSEKRDNGAYRVRVHVPDSYEEYFVKR